MSKLQTITATNSKSENKHHTLSNPDVLYGVKSEYPTRLSVITVNYNNQEGLRDTLISISKQLDKNFEAIVVDGGSTDSSIGVIREFEHVITKWISEPDKGVYQAMNKGVAMANGEYVLFVNSGDCLSDENVISQLNSIDICSDICFGRVLNNNNKGEGHLWEPPQERDLSLQYLRWNILHHPGAIIRRNLQLKYPYDENLRICSDRKFFIQALILGDASYSTIPTVINVFAPSGLSGAHAEHKMFEEDERILNDLFPKRLMRDIQRSNWLTQTITRFMVNYYGRTKLLCNINRVLLRLLKMHKVKHGSSL